MIKFFFYFRQPDHIFHTCWRHWNFQKANERGYKMRCVTWGIVSWDALGSPITWCINGSRDIQKKWQKSLFLIFWKKLFYITDSDKNQQNMALLSCLSISLLNLLHLWSLLNFLISRGLWSSSMETNGWSHSNRENASSYSQFGENDTKVYMNTRLEKKLYIQLIQKLDLCNRINIRCVDFWCIYRWMDLRQPSKWRIGRRKGWKEPRCHLLIGCLI